ncbi:unnamed protein product [Penicillium salamii]|uniref:DNA-(apurinic or apyrimidinic site) endonuclease 2 n=1 Tax=Penicillium salamii TaxID=1612424 RepID=A0A9W4NH06_9EURO|nr:unnamed protein product [Penicillium salamii]CAG7985416.1 unnamed protein product [Penicillium salamii]CAG8166818.1 unnamed protein product [Penicillium salamii]CAG8234434.1 unnamed protein product [Penicillium salamii]CAG8243814.1 unnamed protein product [Penicillium salamii]
MFEILEADIVVLQETKIQRKDLRDDMVLVPGWDCYFRYSGVVIYTRNGTCSPIRAEEGITGVLCPPNSSVPFCNLPEEQQIGGYPTNDQLSRPNMAPGTLDSEQEEDYLQLAPDAKIDASTLDSEGRCVILEFPAFVLIGVYCPAYRDETRDSFRMDFLNALDSRVRNLTKMGKRVIVTGDINISKQTIDSAHGLESIRKAATSAEDFISSPARRLFNQLLSDGVVIGEREQGRETPVLADVCRNFHPHRTGMYTCWDQKLNARPGNFGSRIDYVLCSLDMQDWFSGSNIQEGLMGSDHCPVYVVFKDSVNLSGSQTCIRDILNPPGMFKNGERQQEYLGKFMLPASGRLLPEFDLDKRISIKDMFSRKPAPGSLKLEGEAATTASTAETPGTEAMRSTFTNHNFPDSPQRVTAVTTKNTQLSPHKRPQPQSVISLKRPKTANSATSATPGASKGGQKTLKGFFKPKPVGDGASTLSHGASVGRQTSPLDSTASSPSHGTQNISVADSQSSPEIENDSSTKKERDQHVHLTVDPLSADDFVVDPIASKEDWSKLFTKKPRPSCDGHQEPCISLTTKKPGMNHGRLFWICSRPLGPSGEKEKGTQWRCSTFIWASEWNSSATSQH